MKVKAYYKLEHVMPSQRETNEEQREIGGVGFHVYFLSFHVQSQWASGRREKEHRECCSEVQGLRSQLKKVQDSLHSQELELELQRLRPLDMCVGQRQREQQVGPETHTHSVQAAHWGTHTTG